MQTVSNIDGFLLAIRKRIDEKFKNSKFELSENELIGNLKQELRSDTIGCEECCPLCRRQCEVNHNSGVNKIHECKLGHQL